MKRFAAVFLVLALICTPVACGRTPASESVPVSESAPEAAYASVKDEITLRLGLYGDTANCKVTMPVEGQTLHCKAHLQASNDGKIFENFMPLFTGNEAGKSALSQSVNAIEKEKYYRISLNVVAENPDGSVAEIFTVYSERPFFGLTYNDYNKIIAETLPKERIFSCDSADKAEIGRAAVAYGLGLYGENVPEYCRISDYEITEATLYGVGPDCFCVHVTYDFSTLGGYFRPVVGEFSPHDPTDDERLMHGLDFFDAQGYYYITQLNDGRYKVLETADHPTARMLALVNEDGTMRDPFTVTLMQNGKAVKSLLLDMPDDDYTAFLRATGSMNLGTYIADALSKTQLAALAESILVRQSGREIDYYIYAPDSGPAYFQRDDVVVDTLARAEYDDLIRMIEKRDAQ